MVQTSPEDLEEKGLGKKQEAEPGKSKKCPRTWGQGSPHQDIGEGTYIRDKGKSHAGNYVVPAKQWEDKGFWKEGITQSILPGKTARESQGGSGGLTSIPTSRELLSN